MRRLLAFAEWLCGAHARGTVFEPLVADWQRELSEARHEGPWRSARTLASGAAAFARSLAGCALMSSGWLPTWRASLTAAIAFVATTTAAIAMLLVLSGAWGQQVRGAAWPPLDLASMQTQAFLLYTAVIVAPPALLPALLLMRRDPRSSPRHAAVVIGLAAAGAATLASLTSPTALNAYFSTFEAAEREYARSLANDRAGRYQYPGTAVRQLRGETTLEQRRAAFERFQEWRAEQMSKTPPRPETWRQLWRRFQPVPLAMLFGVMGWTLAGLGAPSIARALLWWGLVLVALMTLTSSSELFLRYVVARFPHPGITVPFFALMTMILVAASWRQGTTSARAPAPKH